MEYARTYLGKPLSELEYTDVQQFFSSEKTESDQIEFKSCSLSSQIDSSLRGVIESISAFLNSSGGLLIWGAPVGVSVPGRREKAFVGDLTQVPLTVEKDWLISKIVDKIIPLPLGIRVQLISTSDSQVAVFEIDESPYAPHQTSNIYYMRVDGQNKPAPHHYVEALMKRISFPRLEAYIKPGATQIDVDGLSTSIEFMFFNFSPFINEERFYYRIIVVGGVFQGASNSPEHRRTVSGMGHLDYTMNGQEYRSNSRNASLNLSIVHGEPHHFTKAIYFPTALLARLGYIARIIISFSGKTAPMKSSEYVIDFNGNSINPSFSISYQNELLSQRQTDRNITEQSTLASLGVLV
ncbi:helix-turn-helix domain-containing protein [Hymenobacter artigasi]|uniref:Schlafen AlbA-2 domain-containing protein n=1 Tax=Hymenobacter artigasi TaxID=2719616 RepID=A0ABX1HIT6_9BACT|nr:ATP-binding protein [Hymenobacter artigasi]NKI90181.1 hypothetical protein [Hymenobacter artigasi]